MRFNYEKKLDLLYVRLKNCPNHYVDQLKDKDFGLPADVPETWVDKGWLIGSDNSNNWYFVQDVVNTDEQFDLEIEPEELFRNLIVGFAVPLTSLKNFLETFKSFKNL